MTATDRQKQASFFHEPVMCSEIIALAKEIPAGVFLDATLGGANHSVALLNSRPDITVLGVDQDAAALDAANIALEEFSDRVSFLHCRFDKVEQNLQAQNQETTKLSGFLFDLGVSSPQLDWADRGFSFRNDGPLDMRMDTSNELSAAYVVNNYEKADLQRVIHRYSDEKFAGRIAAAICEYRPIARTAELAEIVVNAIPAAARRSGGHPAKRTFQAIRIEVNQELEVLRPALEWALEALVPGGRGFVLTYHSGEDKIVKSLFRDNVTSSDPHGLPTVVDTPKFKVVSPAARKASDEEIARNRRSASARLRVIERLAA